MRRLPSQIATFIVPTEADPRLSSSSQVCILFPVPVESSFFQKKKSIALDMPRHLQWWRQPCEVVQQLELAFLPLNKLSNLGISSTASTKKAAIRNYRLIEEADSHLRCLLDHHHSFVFKMANPRWVLKLISRAAIVGVVFIAVLYQFVFKSIIFDALGYGRKVQSIKDFNNLQCEKIDELGLEGCEDMWLHEKTGYLYMACSESQSRVDWLPAFVLPIPSYPVG